MPPDDAPSGHEATTIPVGYVRRAHGIRGDLLVRGTISDASERFIADRELRTEAGDVHRIVASRAKGSDFVIHLADIEDRTVAEALVGTRFVTEPDDRRALGDREWWVEDLVGCTLVSPDGTRIGTVTDVITGPQDRLAIRTDDGRAGEVPFVDALVPDVDVASGLITVDLPEGILG
jgi:16S rRNA processing protein RimM